VNKSRLAEGGAGAAERIDRQLMHETTLDKIIPPSDSITSIEVALPMDEVDSIPQDPAAGRDDPLSPKGDPFGPPEIPIPVHCIHCDEEYESYRIEWRIETDHEGNKHGFWCCPIPGCDGKGFCFDIWPVDPEWTDENGNRVVFFDDDDDEEDFDDDNEPPGNGHDKHEQGPPLGPLPEEDVPF
jgi:hypothetical protein